MARKIVAGNWKMNLDKSSALDLVSDLNSINIPNDVNVIIFPSLILVDSVGQALSSKIKLGVQNFSEQEKGAFTGESSIDQMLSVNATIGLIGHSERRSLFGETNEILKNKVNQAVSKNLDFIFCCGEPLEERNAGNEQEFVRKQLNESLFQLSEKEMLNGVVAYEPIWAIGTGVTASAEQAEEMHMNIRKWIAEEYNLDVAKSVTILYGGSCNAGNASEIFSQENVDGGLIGGASLKSDSFEAIINSFE